jgi:hypothetical protein
VVPSAVDLPNVSKLISHQELRGWDGLIQQVLRPASCFHPRSLTFLLPRTLLSLSDCGELNKLKTFNVGSGGRRGSHSRVLDRWTVTPLGFNNIGGEIDMNLQFPTSIATSTVTGTNIV